MTDATLPKSSQPARSYRWIGIAAAVVLVGAMAFDTKIVQIGSEADVQVQKFSPEAFGTEQFPLIKQSVETRADDAVELAKAVAADKKAASEKYGVKTSTGPVIPVKFTGVIGERKANYNVVAVEGLPAEDVANYLRTVAMGQEAWVQGRLRMAAHPFRGPFISSYWAGNECVRKVRERVSKAQWPKFLETLYGHANSPASLSMFPQTVVEV